MSLGFNPNRKHRVTNLPGSVVGASTLVLPVRHARTRSDVFVVEQGGKRKSPPSALAAVVVPTKKGEPRKTKTAEPEDADDAHWMYGTAARDLPNRRTGDVDIVKGTRALFVYPMEVEKADDRVYMRAKRADPVTGQLSYSWVLVHDPSNEERCVTDFSTSA